MFRLSQFPLQPLWVPRRLNTGFQLLVVLLLSGALYLEWRQQDHLGDAWNAFLCQLASDHAGPLLPAILLMPLNWLAETQKWRRFMRRYEPISTDIALRAVLLGLSVSLLTPNRVGEYGGRMLLVGPQNRWKAMIANLAGNFGQLIVILTAGVLGAAWHLDRFYPQAAPYRWLVGTATASGLCLLHLAYYHVPHLCRLARGLPFRRYWGRFVRELRALEHFSRGELTEIWAWSVLRYGIYSTQYLLILHFFAVPVGLVDGLAAIAVLFLLQTSIPLPPVAGVIARGNFAVYVWSEFGANEIGALAATFTLWIINLILPALIGTFSIHNVKIAKQLGYDDEETHHPGD